MNQPDAAAMTLDQRALLTLHLVPGLGPRLTAALLAKFGTAAAVLRATASELQQVSQIGEHLANQFVQAIRRADVDAELASMAQHAVRVLALGTPEYPAGLAQVPDPPPLLYLGGTLLPQDTRAVGIVGSRQCTAYGRKVAEKLAHDLTRAGYTIVSGLARGIDGAAHRGALKAGGRTLAILAGGLSGIYPPEHKELAAEVRASGALITEASMRMEPMAGMFPARNRIISGLSRAVILVEAAEKSGALITATHAADQGRPVFSVPGPVDSVASGGTNALIRKGAVLVRNAEDVLEELDGIAPLFEEKLSEAAAPPGLDDLQRRIWELLADGPRHADEIVQHLGIQVAQLAGAMLMLEMKKAVRRLPGNRYERA